jgi:hypothetical protein
MSNSWRISTILDNRSQKSLPSAGTGTGATVVRAERSLEKPVLFAKGETQRILSLLGEPTKNNPDLLEAIEYNKSYPIWISSPSLDGYHSALLIGPGSSGDPATPGYRAVTDGFKGINPVTDLSSVTFYKKLTSVEGTKAYSGQTDSWADEYVVESMQILQNGVAIEGITNTEDTFTGTPLDAIETNIYDSATGVVQITFDTEFAVETTDDITVQFTLDLSDYYCMLTTVGAGSAYIKAMVESEGAGAFKLYFQNKNSYGTYNANNNSPIEFSIVPGATNGFGQIIDTSTVFKNHDFFIAHVEGGADFTTFEEGTSYVTLSGGSRDISDLDVTTGYNYFKSFRTYYADVFFDATLDSDVPTLMKELRDTYQKYSRFLLPMANADESTTIETSLGVQDRGFSYFWGWFEMNNLYSKKGNVVWTPMGEIAKNYADSWVNAFGGLSVAWINENGVGGQLTSGRYIRSIYDPSEANLQLMDEARINPIVYDPSYGAMIVSRRTSLAELSDYSFSDYSMIADYILKNITSQVLPYQIVKLNDTIHRNIVRTKTESILQPMTVAPLNVIDSYYVKCDSENNNDEVRAREEFRLDVSVKVTPKSRTLVFTFINTPQTSSVEEMFE